MKTQLTLLATAVMLAGCGGGSGGSDKSLPTYTVAGNINAYAAQGNEKVCIDLNQDFVCDAGEPSATASRGAYSISSTNRAILDAPIVVEIETGMSALSAQAGAVKDSAVLIAPAQGKTSGNDVNAVSTLIAGQVASGDSLQAAVNKVGFQLGRLGLPSDDILNQGDLEGYQTLEQNLLLLINGMEEQDRNAQLYALASKLEQYRGFVLQAAPTDKEAKAVLEKLRTEVSQKGFNDTGITRFLSDSGEVDVEPVDYPGQDAAYGHDTDGAGFEFVKRDNQGQVLDASAQDWSCVEDKKTGLIWEKKIDDAGSPRHFDRLFAYQKTGSFEPFIEDINILGCKESDGICTTEEYVNYLNAQSICGISNWRLPTPSEVYNLIDFGEVNKDSDGLVYGLTTDFFPLQSKASYFETGVVWTTFDMFSEYSALTTKGGYYFNAIQTRGTDRGLTYMVEIYSDQTPSDNYDSYQLATRLVADVEAK